MGIYKRHSLNWWQQVPHLPPSTTKKKPTFRFDIMTTFGTEIGGISMLHWWPSAAHNLFACGISLYLLA